MCDSLLEVELQGLLKECTAMILIYIYLALHGLLESGALRTVDLKGKQQGLLEEYTAMILM